MKLHELGAQRPIEQAEIALENHGNRRIDFSALGPRRAQGMLQEVRHLLREFQSSVNRHTSEKNPAYLRLMFVEQALQVRVKEMQAPVAIDMDDPKTKQVLDKAGRGQTLTPDEQKTVTAVALTKKKTESRQTQRMIHEQNELQQAQVVLAAQDMIDRMQGMLEDISEMQFKDLPALADSIKNDMGVEQAMQFQTAASAAFTTLLQAVQAGKIELAGAQGVLTGQAPQVPGADTVSAAAIEPPAGGEDVDLSLGANLPAGDEEEDEVSVGLGRERR